MQEYTQQIKNLIRDMLRDVHTAIPGRVEAFDADKCEATILPYGKYKKPDGSLIDYPKITGVPMLFLQGTAHTATIVFPVKTGDECLLLFAEQTLDTWRAGTASNTDLRFDLTNAIAIVGLFAKPNPLVREAIEKDAIIIDRSNTRISLLPNNEVEIIGNTTIRGSLTVTDDVTAQKNISVNGSAQIDGTANVVDTLTASSVVSRGIAFNSHKHTSSLPGEETSGPRG